MPRKRHRAKRTPKPPGVSEERQKELLGLTLEATRRVVMCCCHMPDANQPCPQHNWDAWQTFLVAKFGGFPLHTRVENQTCLAIALAPPGGPADLWGHTSGILGMPTTVRFRNAGTRRMVRPTVGYCATEGASEIRRAGEGARQQQTIEQLMALMAACIDEGMKRNIDLYAQVLGNEENVAHMERLGCGYNAVRFRMRPV